MIENMNFISNQMMANIYIEMFPPINCLMIEMDYILNWNKKTKILVLYKKCAFYH